MILKFISKNLFAEFTHIQKDLRFMLPGLNETLLITILCIMFVFCVSILADILFISIQFHDALKNIRGKSVK